MTTESAPKRTRRRRPRRQPPAPAAQSHDEKPDLTGFWMWIPIIIASIGGAIIGNTAAFMALAAFKAGSIVHTVIYGVTGFVWSLAPPLVVTWIIWWVKKETKAAKDARHDPN